MKCYVDVVFPEKFQAVERGQALKFTQGKGKIELRVTANGSIIVYTISALRYRCPCGVNSVMITIFE
jgi:hypothetical protein